MNRFSGLINKTIAFYRIHGFLSTFSKIVRKSFKLQDKEYDTWFRKNQLVSSTELKHQSELFFTYMPLISITVPTFNTPELFLNEMIQSVLNQSYKNWELCLADGSTDNGVTFALLKQFSTSDPRIKIKAIGENKGIAGNSNEAIKMATGDYIAFLDHDDLLTPDALFEVVKAINENNHPDFIYSDEDLADKKANLYFAPFFKPDFAPFTLRNYNYICHFTTISKSLLDKVGYFDSAFDGAQDYDLFLRSTEEAQNIFHVRRILYHWRAHANSTANEKCSIVAKPYTHKAGIRALEAHLNRLAIKGIVMAGGYEHELSNFYTVNYEVIGNPLVSIIIPNYNHKDDLQKCLNSIFTKSSYKNFEMIIVENNSTEVEIFDFYDDLTSKYPNIKVVKWPHEFNYAAINNFGVKATAGDYILLLNNDTEVINEEWLEQLLGICQQEDVGIVGGKLLYSDGVIQSNGIIFNEAGLPGDLGRGHTGCGPNNAFIAIRNVSGVTGACMMTKKSIYQQLGGLDENLKIAYNDVDYCINVRHAGYQIVSNPYAMLYHYESKSRGYEDTPEKKLRLQQEGQYLQNKWKGFLNDPYWSQQAY